MNTNLPQNRRTAPTGNTTRRAFLQRTALFTGAALGTQYRHSQEWTFTTGIAYDSSAVDNDKRTVTVPMGEAWRFALGAQYALTSDITLGAAYEFIWGGDMSVDQYRGPQAGTVSGEYNSANFSVLALNMIWKY